MESIFNFLIPANGKEICTHCSLNIKSLDVSYFLRNYPQFLSLIFDYNSYNLFIKKEKRNLSKISNTIKIKDNEIYNLVGGIKMSNNIHFTCFINKFNYLPNFSNNFDPRNLYYHDEIKNKGYFLEFNNYDELFNMNKKVVPYILLYEK